MKKSLLDTLYRMPEVPFNECRLPDVISPIELKTLGGSMVDLRKRREHSVPPTCRKQFQGIA